MQYHLKTQTLRTSDNGFCLLNLAPLWCKVDGERSKCFLILLWFLFDKLLSDCSLAQGAESSPHLQLKSAPFIMILSPVTNTGRFLPLPTFLRDTGIKLYICVYLHHTINAKLFVEAFAVTDTECSSVNWGWETMWERTGSQVRKHTHLWGKIQNSQWLWSRLSLTFLLCDVEGYDMWMVSWSLRLTSALDREREREHHRNTVSQQQPIKTQT